MGQKINPIGLRLPVNRKIDSIWVPSVKKNYRKIFFIDYYLRNYLESIFFAFKKYPTKVIIRQFPHLWKIHGFFLSWQFFTKGFEWKEPYTHSFQSSHLGFDSKRRKKKLLLKAGTRIGKIHDLKFNSQLAYFLQSLRQNKSFHHLQGELRENSFFSKSDNALMALKSVVSPLPFKSLTESTPIKDYSLAPTIKSRPGHSISFEERNGHSPGGRHSYSDQNLRNLIELNAPLTPSLLIQSFIRFNSLRSWITHNQGTPMISKNHTFTGRWSNLYLYGGLGNYHESLGFLKQYHYWHHKSKMKGLVQKINSAPRVPER